MELPDPKTRPVRSTDAAKLRALAYFLSFRTYGTWLHGDERGSVDYRSNQFGSPRLQGNWNWRNSEEALLAQPPMTFGNDERRVCTHAMIHVCEYRG